MCFQRSEIRGIFLAKKFPPNLLQEIHVNLWLAEFLLGKAASQSMYGSFWRGAWGETFFQKGSSRITPLKPHSYQHSTGDLHERGRKAEHHQKPATV
jgi:hypothetical protein